MSYATLFNAEAFAASLETMVLESTIGARGDEADRHTFQIPATALCNAALLECVRYGFQRKLNDRIGGSDMTTKAKIADTEIWLPTFLDGTWRVESKRSASVSIETRIAREVAKRAIIAKDKSKLEGLKGDDLTAYLDGFIAKNGDKPAFAAEVSRRVAEAKAQAQAVNALADELEF